ncbi:MAG: ArsR/SmtB family transcription factor [Acidimicrobiales bacterium]
MPISFDTPPTQPPRLVVSASVAVELDWVLAAAGHADYRRDHPALDSVYDLNPELRERVTGFWGADLALSCPGFLELTVLAHHGDLLLDGDPGELLARVEDLAASAPTDLPLASESEQDRRALHRRLGKLRTSRPARRRYAALLRDVWAAVEERWLAEGRQAVAAAVSQRWRALSGGGALDDVVGREADFGGLTQKLVDQLGPGGVVAVVPAYFAHKVLLVDLPGVVLVGIGTGSGAEARARTEALARRLKVLADPTRLAILDSLVTSPRTVSELTKVFSIAQPTVSNHVRLLRDAGLVTSASASSGRGRELVAARAPLTDLMTDLEGILRRPEPVVQ